MRKRTESEIHELIISIPGLILQTISFQNKVKKNNKTERKQNIIRTVMISPP